MEMKEIKQMNVFEKLSCISVELSTVAKNLEVGVGQSKYSAVGEADVLRAIKPLEGKYRIYSYPYSRTIIESGTIENESVDYKTKEKVIKKSLFERIEVVYRFVNIDNQQEYIDITSYGDGIDSQDKSVGKAMTYADKYALLKAYKIITGEDPDQYESQALASSQISQKTALDPTLLEEAKQLNINIADVAKYCKKTIGTLTNEELNNCIAMKRKNLNKGA